MPKKADAKRVEEAKKRQLQEDLEKRQSNELKKFIELKTNVCESKKTYIKTQGKRMQYDKELFAIS